MEAVRVRQAIDCEIKGDLSGDCFAITFVLVSFWICFFIDRFSVNVSEFVLIPTYSWQGNVVRRGEDHVYVTGFFSTK